MATINLSSIDFGGIQTPSVKLQEKSVDILLTDPVTEILPDEGFTGMSKITTHHGPVQETVEQTITVNGSHIITPSEGYDAMIQAVVDIQVPEKKIGTWNFTTSENGNFTVKASDRGFDGYSQLGIFVSVPQLSKTYRIPDQWNGSVDSEGLKALNWTDDQISTYQSLCTWMDYENADHLVPEYDKNIEVKNTGFSGDATLQYAKNFDFYNTLGSTVSPIQFFKDCTNLKVIPQFDFSSYTGNVDSVAYNGMFNGCSSLASVPALTFTAGVAMNMFANCSSLTISPKHDLSKLKNMQNFFFNCSALKYIPEFDFSSAVTLIGFYQGTAVEELGNVIAPKCTKANYLFSNCLSLKKVGRIVLADAANNNKMFQGDTALEYVGGFSYRGTYKNGAVFTVEMTNLTHFIMEDYINCTWDTGFLTYCPNLDYESIKSILTAMSKTTLPDTAKSITFANITMQDQNGELQALVEVCVNNKGWTINNLSVTQ